VKSMRRQGGVGYEAQIVSARIAASIPRSKFVPVIRAGELKPGEPDCAIPPHFQGIRTVDMRQEAQYNDRGRDARHRTPPAQIPAGGIPAPGSHLGCLTAKRLSGQGCVIRGLGSHRSCSTVMRFHVTFPFWPRQHSVRRQRLVMLKRKSASATALVGTA
jgi:hypothetical protein